MSNWRSIALNVWDLRFALGHGDEGYGVASLSRASQVRIRGSLL